MNLYLAPMQGVVDYNMRKILTNIGGYHRCVTEFIRVAQFPLPDHTFYRYCPELKTGGRTESGVPVHVQLLGSEPDKIAQHAKQAVRLGALGIDLNFGCPAKVVNRHGGGSALLTQPNLVGEIIKTVRDCLHPDIIVSAKIRLGFDNADRLPEIIEQINAAAPNELCIHARTRQDGYKPPAYWHFLAALNLPNNCTLITNGEIWSYTDAAKALQQSKGDALMLGRGALSCPDLALQIEHGITGTAYRAIQWPDVLQLCEAYFLSCDSLDPAHTGNRTKQWLSYLMREYSEARPFFHTIKRLRARQDIAQLFIQARRLAESDTEQLKWAS